MAGVSHMTVSRYLNQRGNVKAHARERIDAAIAELDYRPNLTARSLRKRREGLLALLVPATENPYSPARIVSAASALAHRAGYEVEVVSVEGGAAERAHRALELSDSGLVEGILSLAAVDRGTSVARSDEAPIVVFEVYDDELRGTGILVDAWPIASFIERLAELGHRRFFHIAGPAGHPPADERRRVYNETIERLGLESHGMSGGGWPGSTAVDAVRGLDEDCGVTAIIAANDELAAGAIHAALERGWRVPADVSVTGWDNQILGEFLPPGLTTVHVNHDLLGEHAMSQMLARLDGSPAIAEPDVRDLNQLLWRGSVGPRADQPAR